MVPSTPAPFTNDDFAARMRRVVSSASEKGLAGVIVTPGPGLAWLTGYRPPTTPKQCPAINQIQSPSGSRAFRPVPSDHSSA
jgi:hypothetical protein